jgi:hypothetical protein
MDLTLINWSIGVPLLEIGKTVLLFFGDSHDPDERLFIYRTFLVGDNYNVL